MEGDGGTWEGRAEDAQAESLLSSVQPPAPVGDDSIVSRGRWFVLATATLLAAGQGAQWAVPGALAPTMEAVNGISGDDVQLLLNIGCIVYLPCALPFMWLLDRHGLRGAVGIAIALVFAGNLLRCFVSDAGPTSTALLYLSFVINAVAGPVAMACPSKLAESWFAPQERTTATAIAALGNMSGPLWAYLLVPLVCPDGTPAQLVRFNGVLTAAAALNGLMWCAYFPQHSPSPPSASAVVTRQGEARVSLASLATAGAALAASPPYLALVFAYAVAIGLFNCVSALLTSSLAQVGASQAVSGWVGAAGNAVAIIAGISLAAAADRLKAQSRGALRAALVASIASGGAAMLAYAASIQRGSFSLAVVSYCAAQACLGAFVPICFDCAAELTYPAPEATVLMGLTAAINATSIGFLLVPAASFLRWAPWTASALMLGSGALLAMMVPLGAPRFEFDKARSTSASSKGDDDSAGGRTELAAAPVNS